MNFKQWCEEKKAYTLLEMYENDNNKYKSDNIGFSSAKLVKWKCNKCKMEWEQSLNKTTKRRLKECPYCTHKRVSPFYNLETEYPNVAKEWDYIKNNKIPTEFSPKSKEKVWWKCEKGHSWKSAISDRTHSAELNLKAGRPICPFCNHKKVSNSHNLVTEYPNIAKQWDYTRNGSITPLKTSPKSNKKVWWVCEFNNTHRWQEKVCNRTALHRGCPKCSKQFTISFTSRVIFYYLKSYFSNCEMEYKIFGKYNLDIYIPDYKIIIEYDGIYYHSDKSAKTRESKKDEILTSKGFDIIRIKETKEPLEEFVYKNNVIYFNLKERYANLNELVRKVIDIIEDKINVKINIDIDVNRDYEKIENLYFHIRKSNSVAVQYPNLAKEWSDNNPMSVDCVSVGSGYKAKWICPKCNKEYDATIYNRIKNKSNCSFCANMKVCYDNSLAKMYPEIAKEWNYEKNGELLPTDVVPGCDKKVWWKCEKGHEWQARIYSRTGKSKTKCPDCAKILRNVKDN